MGENDAGPQADKFRALWCDDDDAPSEEVRPMPRPGRGAQIVKLLNARDGKPTLVALEDGSEVTVWDIAWGRDDGEDWEHVTTNSSPGGEGRAIDFFLTSEVVSIRDAETGEALDAGEEETSKLEGPQDR